MALGLKRFQHSKQSHFVTFSCYKRQPLLNRLALRNKFLESLENTRNKYGFRVYGYVLMPEHVHLLLSEPGTALLARALQSLKISVARIALLNYDITPFWQKRYYDHNVRDYESFVEKLRYLHRNPVKRGLVERPEDWEWSSFNLYATGKVGMVQIESEWSAKMRERSTNRGS